MPNGHTYLVNFCHLGAVGHGAMSFLCLLKGQMHGCKNSVAHKLFRNGSAGVRQSLRLVEFAFPRQLHS